MKTFFYIFLTAILLSTLPSLAQDDQNNFAERFDVAWHLVDDRYWDKSVMAKDWDEVYEEYSAQLADVSSEEEFYALLEAMYQEIGDKHSNYLSPEQAAEIRKAYGDLPCLVYLGQSDDDIPEDMGAILAYGEDAGVLNDLYSRNNVAYQLLENDIGYIRLADLATLHTPSYVRDAVEDLAAEGASSYILDLRKNPGGRLIEMMQVAGVFTSGFLWRAITSWSLPLPYPAIGSVATDAPLVVLSDQHVHSAAEGLAGALQAKGRAVVVGARSAGNVEAVMPFCLRDGSQAWVATGVLAPLLGRTWEGQGVLPDVESSGEDALQTAIAYLRSE